MVNLMTIPPNDAILSSQGNLRVIRQKLTLDQGRVAKNPADPAPALNVAKSRADVDAAAQTIKLSTDNTKRLLDLFA
jgi:hypothetical protein